MPNWCGFDEFIGWTGLCDISRKSSCEWSRYWTWLTTYELRASIDWFRSSKWTKTSEWEVLIAYWPKRDRRLKRHPNSTFKLSNQKFWSSNYNIRRFTDRIRFLLDVINLITSEQNSFWWCQPHSKTFTEWHYKHQRTRGFWVLNQVFDFNLKFSNTCDGKRFRLKIGYRV